LACQCVYDKSKPPHFELALVFTEGDETPDETPDETLDETLDENATASGMQPRPRLLPRRLFVLRETPLYQQLCLVLPLNCTDISVEL
jgi:hypothetical protein